MINFSGSFYRKSSVFFLCIILGLSSCKKEEDPQVLDEISPLPENGSIIEGEYLVVLKDDAVPFEYLKTSENYFARTSFMQMAVDGLLRNHKISTGRTNEVYTKVFKGFSARLDKEMLERLKADERVAYIEPDRIVTLSPIKHTNVSSISTSNMDPQQTPYGIKRVGGYKNYTGSNVAYIIDTGLDLNHPDLNVDASIGFNGFRESREPRYMSDNNGHGTHVAGIIGAKNNSFGVVGVAAGVRVVPVKVLDKDGIGTYSRVIAGIDYVGTVGKPGDVANLSLGGPASQAMDDAVIAASANVKFVIAAGNSSSDAGYYSPSRVTGKNIYTISAMDEDDTWAYFSNSGNPPIKYCAPGLGINSTWRLGEYAYLSGTSMAAPHASGVLLLGNPKTSGYVKNDPDGTRDPIISR